MRLEIDQAARPRHGRMIGCGLVQLKAQEAANTQGVRGTPDDGALEVDPSTYPSNTIRKYRPRRQHRTANLVGVKLLAQRLDVPVEVGIVPASDSTVCRKGARRSAAGLARPPTSTPASHDVVVCPSPCATVAVRVIDRVDL
jgi:hypothetical protein